MKSTSFLLFSLLVSAASISPAVAGAENFADIVRIVNSEDAGWTAAEPSRFSTTADAAVLCGTWMPGHPKYVALELPAYDDQPSFQAFRPKVNSSLDWRTKAPQCSVISKIRDQSACGSCWAFGSTETFEDRRCIQTGQDIEFSAWDTGSCCMEDGCGNGCNGGNPTQALKWMSETGVVTGGDYGDRMKGTGCSPYQFPPCAHHTNGSKYPACPTHEYGMACAKQCSDSLYRKNTYAHDKVAEGTVMAAQSATAMMTALEGGPLSVAFTVFADFPAYKSGVYKHTTGSPLGGHAVSVIGYGNENGEDYWLVRNSWNEGWGDGGTFKILRGVNECGIESQAAAINFGSRPGPGPAPGPAGKCGDFPKCPDSDFCCQNTAEPSLSTCCPKAFKCTGGECGGEPLATPGRR